MVYNRVLLKLSGEALGGGDGRGFDFTFMEQVCRVIKTIADTGVETGIVVGGGNFWRGARDARLERARSDQIGMLATAMNCLALAGVLEQLGAEVRVQTAIEMRPMAEPYIRLRAIRHLQKGRIVIFGCGTGHPYFSTDTAAVLRAAEINAEVILLAKNVDGVYSGDPKKNPNATRYDHISYSDVLANKLEVMDFTATTMAMENNIPSLVFALNDPENIMRVVRGEHIGTRVDNG